MTEHTTFTPEQRQEKFEARRAQLQQLNDEQLKARFWELCDELVKPMVELARTHTSPSIERSVLLRMGIDSVTSQAVVSRVLDAGLLGKGAGNVLWRVSKREQCDLHDAAKRIVDDPSVMDSLFEGGAA